MNTPVANQFKIIRADTDTATSKYLRLLSFAIILLAVVACGGGDNNPNTNTEQTITISGTVSTFVSPPASKLLSHTLRPRGADVDWSTATIKVVDFLNPEDVVAEIQGAIAIDGSYSITVPIGGPYLIKASSGNMFLEAFVPKSNTAKMIDVDPESTAVAVVLLTKYFGIKKDELADELEGIDIVVEEIKASAGLAGLVDAIENDIADNYDPNAVKSEVGVDSIFGNDLIADILNPPKTIAHTITASLGEGEEYGSISPIGNVTVNDDDAQTFTITPTNECNVVKEVIVDGKSIGATSSYSFSGVKTDHSISASFGPLYYILYTYTGEGGDITNAGGLNDAVNYVRCGEAKTITITPDEGYAIKDVLVDERSVGAVSSYTFTDSTDATVTHKIQAWFKPISAWTDSVGLVKPESFMGVVGPKVNSNNHPEGDPFADLTAIRHQELEVLGLPSDRDYALLAGEKMGVWDLQDGTEVTRLEFPSYGNYHYLGGLILVAPESYTDGVLDPPEWLLYYTSLGGGYSITRYFPDPAPGGWGPSRAYPNSGMVVTDMVPGPLDENGRDTGYLIVDYGGDQLIYAMWNTEQQKWQLPSGHVRTGGEWRKNSSSNPISAVGGFYGPALVLVNNGEDVDGSLWLFDPQQEYDVNTDQNLGSVGNDPRQLRCLRGVCVASNYGDTTITIVSWKNSGSTPTIKGTHDVGGTPFAIDLIADPDGNGVLALTTGINENNFTVTNIDGDGLFVEKTITPLTACESPSNGRFTDGNGDHVMITCNESDQVIIKAR